MRNIVVLAASACGAALCPPAAVAEPQTEQGPVATTPASADARARQTLAQMTLDEKLAMLSGISGTAAMKADPREKRIGAGFVPGVPRLAIPDLWETDAGLGVATASGVRGDFATALPSSLATAASFDPSIARAGGAMIGAEARAKGFNVLLGGGVNLVRDPWGGRAFEYYSEDPLVSGIMGGEAIAGIQSNRIISTIKHYALNPQETGRTIVDARMSREALRQSDLLAFEIGIERGQPGSVMCAYNKVLGDWACENDWLLNTVLKEDWGYRGWVMSDWGAVHSTEKAALAGLDQESGREAERQSFFHTSLREAVSSGRVPASAIDDKVLRILRMIYEHGLVDHPTPAVPTEIEFEAHADVAQRAAEAGIVLLKNQRKLLPLSPRVGRVAVIGGHANAGVLSGGGSTQVRSVGGYGAELPVFSTGPFANVVKMNYHASPPFGSIARRVGEANASFTSGADIAEAVRTARDADVAIVFATEWRAEALDRENLNLPPEQDALIKAVIEANPRTVVVLQTGGPVLMPWLDRAMAVVEAWYPGQRGGEAIARILFGEANPSARLPVTFPASADQPPRPEAPGFQQVKAYFENLFANPPKDMASIDLNGGMTSLTVDYQEGADVGYRWYARRGWKPAFAFGHGLSYSKFAYSKLELPNGVPPAVTFTLRNTSARSGAEVAQVYAASGSEVPRLVGFSKINLSGRSRQTVQIPLDWRPLSTWDEANRRWVLPQTPITISVGASSDDIRLTGTVPAR